jgi:hypothetical protein
MKPMRPHSLMRPSAGHQERARFGEGHAHAGFQRAGEEGIEGRIARRIGFLRFGHVDAKLAHDGIDEPLLGARVRRVRELARQRREESVRQDIGEGGDRRHGVSVPSLA